MRAHVYPECTSSGNTVSLQFGYTPSCRSLRPLPQILQDIGFEFGEVAQLTDEWESRFDQLLDWKLWNVDASRDSCGVNGEFSWLGADWGARGGPGARELALWMQLQREFRRRSLLSAEGIQRLTALGFEWEAQVR